MKNISHIVFYGTLMQKDGGRGIKPNLLTEYVQDIEFKGNLYNLGAFPAMVMGDGVVKGELHKIIDPDSIERFDRIEGYREPNNSLYTRTVLNIPGTHEFAWVYTFNGPIEPNKLIPSGDWSTRNV